MTTQYKCHECGLKYELDTHAFRCECGGLFDLEKPEFEFSRAHIVQEEWSLFRYIEALPFEQGSKVWKEISMGEGLTPILPLDPGMANVWVKLDYAMPTLSFKDRGAVVLIAKAKELGQPMRAELGLSVKFLFLRQPPLKKSSKFPLMEQRFIL